MHAAPPVRVSLSRAWAWPVFVAAVAGAAVGNLVGWALLHRESTAALPLALLSAVLVGMWTAWRLHRNQAVGDLQWDGVQWQWRGVEGQAEVALDLGGWMLLRFEPHAGLHQWLAASRNHSSGPWAALRAALHSPRPADPLDVPPA